MADHAQKLLDGQGRAVVIAEHRLERLLPEAAALLTVDNGRVTTGPPTPPPHHPIARLTPSQPGPVSWPLIGVTAGLGRHLLPDKGHAAPHAGEAVALCGPNCRRQPARLPPRPAPPP